MDGHKPPIEKEELYLNGKLMVSRNSNGMVFNENKMPKSSPSESLILILRLEDEINPVFNAWQLIIDSQVQKPEKLALPNLLWKSVIKSSICCVQNTV
jgi:hypothetical protein